MEHENNVRYGVDVREKDRVLDLAPQESSKGGMPEIAKQIQFRTAENFEQECIKIKTE